MVALAATAEPAAATVVNPPCRREGIGLVEFTGRYNEPDTGHPGLIERAIPKPSAEQMANVYPQRSLMLEMGSLVLMDCEAASGSLTHCRAIAERPGLGFEAAALSFAQTLVVPANAVGKATIKLEFKIVDVRCATSTG